MSWISSFFVAALTGVLGIAIAGMISATCAEWFHVSNREGGAGYLMIAVALLGGAIAFAVGLLLSRVVAGMPEPGFLKALGISCGAVLALGGLALGIAWLKADFAPKIDGQSLALAIEMRCPKDFTLPTKKDKYGTYACVYLPRGRSQARGEVDLTRARQIDGRWIITSVVPLNSSSSDKYLEVSIGTGSSITFWLPLRRHPRRSDMEWGEWRDSSWNAGEAQPPPEKRFNLRYKVQLVAPGPTAEATAAQEAAADQAKFDALNSDSPLEEWLAILTPDATEERKRTVMKIVDARLPDLANLIRSDDANIREAALGTVDHLTMIMPQVTEAVLAEGRAIAEGIRRFNQMKTDDTDFHDVPLQLNSRFNTWKQAWWTLHQRLGVDGRPPVREIHDVATIRAAGTAIAEIEGNARVMLDALKPAPGNKP